MGSPHPGMFRPIAVAFAVFLLCGVGVTLVYFFVQDFVLLSSFEKTADIFLREYAPPIVLAAGLGGSLLLALFVYVSVGTQARAHYIAKQLTKKVSKSSAWYEHLYEYSPVAYLLLTPDGIIHEPNKSAVRLFETEVAELEGKPFSFLFPDEKHIRERVHDDIARFERGISVPEHEIQIQRLTGAFRWVLLSIHTVGTVSGRAPHTGIVTLFDITERRAVEQAKSEFVSLASHQLMTPLSAIKWYTGMLKSGAKNLSDAQLRYIQKIYEGNERMIDLINTLLNISRVELGTLAIEATEIAVDQEIESTIGEVEKSNDGTQAAVLRDYGDGEPTLITDPHLFRLIMQNLLSNALKYTPADGTVRVLVSEEGSGLRIDVADTGYGIPPDQQDRIFSKMFRADNVRNEQKGTGLGLYMTKSVVELLGGTISFTSEENVGTTFTVWFPEKSPKTVSKGKRLSLRGIS